MFGRTSVPAPLPFPGDTHDIVGAILRLQEAFEMTCAVGPMVLILQRPDFERLRLMLLSTPMLAAKTPITADEILIGGMLVRRASDDVRLRPWGV